MNLVLSFYSITFLQRMMEKRKRLLQAEIAIHRIFNNPRLSIMQPMALSAFESKLIFSSVSIMIFKEMLSHTGIISEMPHWFQALPITPAIIFALIFFFGTLIAGTQSMVAIVTPIAFLSIPQAGIPLLVLLISMSYIAAQISPTHICLSIVVDYFKVPFGSLIKKTVPVLIPFVFVVFGYYYLMLMLT